MKKTREVKTGYVCSRPYTGDPLEVRTLTYTEGPQQYVVVEGARHLHFRTRFRNPPPWYSTPQAAIEAARQGCLDGIEHHRSRIEDLQDDLKILTDLEKSEE